MKSVKSMNPCKTDLPSGRSVILTIYDIGKADGGVPIMIGIKVESMESEGTEFIINLPLTQR